LGEMAILPAPPIHVQLFSDSVYFHMSLFTVRGEVQQGEVKQGEEGRGEVRRGEERRGEERRGEEQIGAEWSRVERRGGRGRREQKETKHTIKAINTTKHPQVSLTIGPCIRKL
jgi:hypothetical protein